MSAEKELVKYLKETFDPIVIALSGSRASGNAAADSDWDLYLFCDQKNKGGFYQWNNHLLDITFQEWPKPDDWVFTSPMGPVAPVSVLFDNSHGVFQKILDRTDEVRKKGPLHTYADGCQSRMKMLQRLLGKLEKYSENKEVQFYYIAYLYELLLRAWFEQQNLWPWPPALAVSEIKQKDSDFGAHLSHIASGEGGILETARKAVQRIEEFQSQ